MSGADRERWDARYRAGGGYGRRAPPRWLDEVDGHLPRQGRALDVASGTGRIAVWLARRGLDVTAVDVSPVGLSLAREVAADEGVRLATEIADLERDPLPDGPYELIACVDYRQPSLFPEMVARLAPGGVLVAQLATVHNLERHQKPSRRFLAEPGELREAAGDLDVLLYGEGWYEDRHVARLVARRGEEGS
ncbi:MAG: class I SAM-dependent methyltransferase [Polyangiales bacterium]